VWNPRTSHKWAPPSNAALFRPTIFDKGEDTGTENCPLCLVFNSEECNECTECPVKRQTRQICCIGTPYIAWIKHQNTHDNAYPFRVVDGCDKCKRLTLDELNFLRSLLPKE
jgi:hypothetical protein